MFGENIVSKLLPKYEDIKCAIHVKMRIKLFDIGT